MGLRWQTLLRAAVMLAAWGAAWATAVAVTRPAMAAGTGATPSERKKASPPPRTARPAKEARPSKEAKPVKDGSRHPRGRPAAPAKALGPVYGERADVRAFARQAAERRGLDSAWVEGQLAQARQLPAVQRLIMPPPAGTAKNWAAYRTRFIDRTRIDAGLRFWRTHARWLEQAHSRWGVPAEMVVAVIGVETFYGRHMGTFRVLDALATLAFDFPSGRSDRSGFFREELEELLALAAREGVPASQWRGSYAGAMGLPQFMPSSIARWAVDFDEDGHIDLHANAADAIGSVAHYLAAFGWRSDVPTHFSVAAPVDTRSRAELLAPDILPTFTPAQFVARGAELPAEALAHDGPLALVELQNGEAAPSYVAGTSNFYVVTRYNWSAYYAMAVIDLAQELAREGAAAR